MSELPALASSANNASGFQQIINAVAIRLSSGNSVSAPVVEQVCLGFEYSSNGEDRIVVLLLGLVFPVQAHGYPAGGVPAVRHSNAAIATEHCAAQWGRDSLERPRHGRPYRRLLNSPSTAP
jgi:hypothetical protein